VKKDASQEDIQKVYRAGKETASRLKPTFRTFGVRDCVE
jgi:hypothetical protein